MSKFNTVSKEMLDQMTGPALIALHNEAAALLGGKSVKRFATKGDVLRRTWAQVQAAAAKTPAPVASAPKASPAPAAASAQGKVQAPSLKLAGAARPKAAAKPAKPKKRRGTNLLPSGDPLEACRAGSKQAILVDMLSCKQGDTMPELLEALAGGRKPWIEATVRSGFGWDLKRKGYGVRSRFDADGTERFHLVVPEGELVLRHIGDKTAHDNRATKPATRPAPRVRSRTGGAVQVTASRGR